MRRKDTALAQSLVRRRAALLQTLAGHTNMIAVGDRAVGDSIDAAVDCEQVELGSQLAAVESRELAAIEAAFDRIRDGLYGVCEACEKAIPMTRLQALPYATLCINCQREEERLGHSSAATNYAEPMTDVWFDDKPNRSNGLEFEFA